MREEQVGQRVMWQSRGGSALWVLFCFLLFVFITPSLSAQEDPEGDPCEQKLDKKVQKQIKKAKDLMTKGNTQRQGLEIYRELMEEDPTILEVNYRYALFFYSNLARVEFNQPVDHKDFKEALSAFKRLYDVCPHYKPMANLFAARVAFFSGHYDDAIIFAKEVVDNPDLFSNDAHLDEAKFILRKSKFNKEIFDQPRAFDPQPVAHISTQHDEYLASITADGEMIYFTRRMPIDKKSSPFAGSVKEDQEFFSCAKRRADGTFNVGEPLPWPFNDSKGEGSPTLNLTNDILIFARLTDGNIGGTYYPNWDLYISYLIDGEWTEPANMGPNINNPDSWESQPSLSSDGKTLYFASDRRGGYGGSDIWRAERNADGSWNKAKNLGPVINTKGNERSPFLHSDSKTLYFSSDGVAVEVDETGRTSKRVDVPGLHLGIGGQDVFYSKMDPNTGEWTKPINLGYPINTPLNEVDFFVSLDGTTAYFSSNNMESQDWNVYQFELYEEARPKSVVLIKGEVESDVDDYSDITVEIRDTSLNVVASTTVNENTKKYAVVTEIDTYDPKPIIVNVKKEGFAFDTRVVVPDLPKGRVIKTEAEVKKVEVGKSFDLRDIYFATNSYQLVEQSKKLIILFAEFLKENPTIKVELEGHTDNVGRDKDNQILSENRARAVYQFLIAQGIDAARLSYKGYGASRPIAPNTTEEGKAKNRRTVFIVLDI
ncbi:MAG: OmpA family protein [Bacteroidales bacterium]|jgi:outer membrane protein OmpA-like peptidoglycan-associated protein